jgi:hypothetical protein
MGICESTSISPRKQALNQNRKTFLLCRGYPLRHIFCGHTMWQTIFDTYNDEIDKLIDSIDPTHLNKTQTHYVIESLNIFSNWCRRQIYLLSQNKVVFMSDMEILKTRIEDNKELVALIRELGTV